MAGEFYGFREESLGSFIFVLIAGLIAFAIIIGINLLTGLTIGGAVPFAIEGWKNAIGIIILAGIGEALLFRMILLPIMVEFFGNPFYAILANAGVFSIFHWGFYGGFSTGSIGLFWGAFIFGLVMASFCVATKSVTPAAVAHSGFNGWLWNVSPATAITLSIAFIPIFMLIPKRWFKK